MAQARAGWQYASQAYPAVLPEQLEMLAALAQRHPELESLKSN